MQLMHGIFDFAHGDAFALAHQGVVDIIVFLDAGRERAVSADGGALAEAVALGGVFLVKSTIFRARQRLVGGDARRCVAQLGAYGIGSDFAHQAVGHHLAARDGDKALQSVAWGVV